MYVMKKETLTETLTLVHDTKRSMTFASLENCRIKYDQPQHDSNTTICSVMGLASAGEAGVCILIHVLNI